MVSNHGRGLGRVATCDTFLFVWPRRVKSGSTRSSTKNTKTRKSTLPRVPDSLGTCASGSVPALVAEFLLQGPIGVLLETFLVGDSITPAPLLSHRSPIHLKFLFLNFSNFNCSTPSSQRSPAMDGGTEGRMDEKR